MRTLQEAIRVANHGSIPTILTQAEARISEQYRAGLSVAQSSKKRIYGLNTFPGHLDRQAVARHLWRKFQEELIENHAIGGPPYFNSESSRAITVAKAYSVAAGGSFVSPETYRHILAALENDSFNPSIPCNASYSSGDVIPGSHWAVELVEWIRREDPSYQLQPGEGLALINGAFVHVGSSLPVAARLNRTWHLLLFTLKQTCRLVAIDRDALLREHNAEKAKLLSSLSYISDQLRKRNQSSQPPVSVRSIPEIIDGFLVASQSWLRELNYSIFRPSGNPLIRKELDGAVSIASSASFLQPSLTLSGTSLLDAFLMCAWGSVQRLHYVLSGDVDGIPVNGRGDPEEIGYIQWPKNAQAKLEALRHDVGSLAFVSGGVTSYGVEDFWTHGTHQVQRMHRALDCLDTILGMEAMIVDKLTAKFTLRSSYCRPDDPSFVSEAGVQRMVTLIVDEFANISPELSLI